MSTMRGPILVLMLLAVSCKGKRTREESTTPVGKVAEVKDALAKDRDKDEEALLVQRAERNVDLYFELILQGQTQDAVRVHLAVAGAVDRDFEVFVGVARKHRLFVRSMAVKCLGFASAKRREARDVLLSLLEDRELTIIQNAVFGLGILKDKETDLTPIIRLCGSGDVVLRENAATALKGLFLVKQTPRSLTPQYHAAIERLLVLLHDKNSVRSRRAAAWAFANMRHPGVLDHLIAALGDSDEQVQIGGLHGIEMLGDQRALDPVFEFLETAPTTGAASWAHKALCSIAISMGFAKSATELQALGTNPRHWRAWFRERRNR